MIDKAITLLEDIKMNGHLATAPAWFEHEVDALLAAYKNANATPLAETGKAFVALGTTLMNPESSVEQVAKAAAQCNLQVQFRFVKQEKEHE